MSAARLLYWSVKRELWENRSIYLAPLAVAAMMLFGLLISMLWLPQRVRGLSALTPAKQHELVSMPYNAVGGLMVMTAFIVGVFYCIDALYGERRDRSILFWKSMPVSDRTTVLAKASIPLVVLPLLILPVILGTQLIVLLFSSVILMLNGISVATQWQHLPLIQMTVALLYCLPAIALWHAPVYAWLLLVSAWSRRAVFLWALLPQIVISVFEKAAFGTSNFAEYLQYRFWGWFPLSFDFSASGSIRRPVTVMTPGDFLSTPGLWGGLLFAALFLALAVRLRRNREPI
ncbi:MAG TPA: ABC transporter permease [Thermoanaerobaculia bacterium]|nr:ABC transporter permease [Thermoanaerobaculia bacterium]